MPDLIRPWLVIAFLGGCAAPTTPDAPANPAFDDETKSDGTTSAYADVRRDVRRLDDAALRTASRSVVALVQSSRISITSDRATLQSVVLSEQGRDLCATMPFLDEPTLAFCTGALIAPDIVLTAGHCFRNVTCENTRFVFDFVNTGAASISSTPRTNVFACREIIESRIEGDVDYAIVRLDRAVSDRAPLRVAAGPPDLGTATVLFGHGLGLPLKASPGGRVARLRSDGFDVNVLGLSGDSGGPLLDARTREIIGTVVGSGPSIRFDGPGRCGRTEECSALNLNGPTLRCTGTQFSYTTRPAAFASDVTTTPPAPSCTYTCAAYSAREGQCLNGWSCEPGGCLRATGCCMRCADYRYAEGQCYADWRCRNGCLQRGC